jgi:hypothetical protein
MTIKITPNEENQTFSIDLLTHIRTGEKYIVKYVADWDNFGTDDDPNWQCIGGHIAEACGPLHYTDVAALRTDPYNWDGDQGLEDDIVNDDYTWEEIYSGEPR